MSPDSLTGILNALSVNALIANLMGTALGIIFGALPGLTAAMGVALLIPVTFGMPPVDAFSALLGMYVGAIYGGCITAILVGTPGTVAAAATVLEGPALTAKGQSRKALHMATFGSLFGGMFSAVALVTIAPLLAKVALNFGAPEYFAVAVFGLTVVASLSSGHMIKGFISALVGMFICTVGLDPVTGDLRNTFGNPNLFNGVAMVPTLIGLFAVSQIFVTIEQGIRGNVKLESKLSTEGLRFREIKDNFSNLIRSSCIGTIVGIIPAMGVSAAVFISYSEAKRFAKHPELFGKGSLEGIAATESANNAVCGGALIPLITLGVPGDIITAVMLGALMIQGLTPGPLLFVQNPAVVYGIFTAFILANLFMYILGMIAVRPVSQILKIPTTILMPVMLTLCAVGGFAVNNSMFDLAVVAVFGIAGYLMHKCDIPQPPLILAMVLTPIAETNFRRALAISQGDYATFYTNPVFCVIMGITLLIVIKTIRDEIRIRAQHKEQTATPVSEQQGELAS